MTTDTAPELLYLDSSAFLRRAFGHDGADAVDAAVARCSSAGGVVASSRLLRLEARRVAIREATLGNDVRRIIEANLSGVASLPLTEDVWAAAAAIPLHIKTLDSLHVATCRLVGGRLLTFDTTMRAVAEGLGVPLA